MGVTNLKLARIKKGISQWQLAGQIGIGYTKLSMIETGRIEATDEVKRKCSKVLGIPIRELFPE